MASIAYQQCINTACAATLDLADVAYACPTCGSLLDVRYDWSRCALPRSLAEFDHRLGAADSLADASGVWRFRELLPIAPVGQLVTIGEGRTILQPADQLARAIGLKPNRLHLQYEGFNPSGSFKDNGMAAAFTIARIIGRSRVACASTGNTSASMALFAAQTSLPDGSPMRAIVFVGQGKIAMGKLAQALDYGALTLQVAGDFDVCMRLVQESAAQLGLYLMNSVNPFRLEGQKTIMYRVLQGLRWEVPDWIVVPGGNLGNTSAFGKAFVELRELELIDRVPRIAVINAQGADTFSVLVNRLGLRYSDGRTDEAVERHYREMQRDSIHARTVASAIEIARPVNLAKALRTLHWTDGVVRSVCDEAILDGKALIGRHGYGCEPAGGATIAGLRVLREEGLISAKDRVVCIVTGHPLKDSDATVKYHAGNASESNHPRPVEPTLEAIRKLVP